MKMDVVRRIAIASIVLASACVDKARADWDRCIERDKSYDVPGAYSACAAAAAADPNSSSGQAAKRKLGDLQLMMDKMKAEQADKAARDDAIKKASEVAATTATAQSTSLTIDPMQTAYDGGVSLDEVRARVAKGDVAGARTLLEARAMTGNATSDELSMLITVCKGQRDKACVKKYSAMKRH